MPELRRAVLERLAARLVARADRRPAGPRAGPQLISYESIYRFIYAQIAPHQGLPWRHYLPRAKSKARLARPQGGSPQAH